MDRRGLLDPTTRPPIEIIQDTANDQHLLLYYLLLHAWLRPGEGMFQERYLLVLLEVPQVAAIMRLGHQLVGSRTGYLVGGWAALAPTLIWCS